MSQQHLESPQDLFQYQLRSALTMEEHSLQALDDLHSAARDSKVKKLFSHHADETKDQIANLKKSFELFDVKESTAPSPATTGIKTQAAGLLDKAATGLHTQIALMSALGNEHFEISSYMSLILQAELLQLPDVAKLLQENLEQEKHTSEELEKALKEVLS